MSEGGRGRGGGRERRRRATGRRRKKKNGKRRRRRWRKKEKIRAIIDILSSSGMKQAKFYLTGYKYGSE